MLALRESQGQHIEMVHPTYVHPLTLLQNLCWSVDVVQGSVSLLKIVILYLKCLLDG